MRLVALTPSNLKQGVTLLFTGGTHFVSDSHVEYPNGFCKVVYRDDDSSYFETDKYGNFHFQDAASLFAVVLEKENCITLKHIGAYVQPVRKD